jgi:hypothetical protein
MSAFAGVSEVGLALRQTPRKPLTGNIREFLLSTERLRLSPIECGYPLLIHRRVHSLSTGQVRVASHRNPEEPAQASGERAPDKPDKVTSW